MNSLISKPRERRLRERILLVVEASPSLRKMHRRGWPSRIAAWHRSFRKFLENGPFQSAFYGLVFSLFSLLAGIVLTQFIGMGVMLAVGIPESLGQPVLEWYATLFIPILFTLVCAIGDNVRIVLIGHRHLRHFATLPLPDADLFRKAWAENAGHSAVFFFFPSTLFIIALGIGLWPAPGQVEGWNLGFIALGFITLWLTAKSLALGFIAPGRRAFRLLPGRMNPFLVFLLLPVVANVFAVRRKLRVIRPVYVPESLFSVPQYPTPTATIAPARTSLAPDSDIAALAIRARLFEETREPFPHDPETFFSKRWLTKPERALTQLLRSEDYAAAWFTWKSIVVTLLCSMLLDGISRWLVTTDFITNPDAIFVNLSKQTMSLAFFMKWLSIGGFFGISLMPVSRFLLILTSTSKNIDRTASLELSTLNETYPITATLIRSTVLKEAVINLAVFVPIITTILAYFCLTPRNGRENWFDLAMYTLRFLLLIAAFLPFFWTLRAMNMARINRVFAVPRLAFTGLIGLMPVLFLIGFFVPFAFSHLTALAVTPVVFLTSLGAQRLVEGLFEWPDVDLKKK